MENRTALVTGANRGIGLAVVKGLLDRGIRVLLTARSEKKGREATEKLSRNGDLDFHLLDVSDPGSVEEVREYVKGEFGRLDILINNAGINYDSWQNALEADMEVVRQTLETNFFGAWRMSQAFIPMMAGHGYGRIVNVSSGSGSFAEMGGGTPAYAASKAAMNVLTVKLASDLEGTGVLVNSVCPGWVRTEMGGPSAPRSVEKGADTIIWAAMLPGNGPSGKFFRDRHQISF